MHTTGIRRADRVLDGVRVIEFGTYVAAPFSGTVLAQMGAEVIKVERPGGNADRELGPFAPNGEPLVYGLIIPCNKKGITVDIRHPKGSELVKRLVQVSDVVIHNYVKGSEEAKILSYEALCEVNPRVILAAVSGFGQTGPYSERVCFDSIAQAMSGMMSYTGFPEDPPTRAAAAVVDVTSGISAALGVVLALYHRQKTGIGQMVDLALIDVAICYVAAMGVAAEYEVSNVLRQQIGNSSFYNLSNCFRAKDGWVMINVIGRSIWRRLCQVIDRPELIEDPRFADDMIRFQNRHVIEPILNDWVSERTIAEVITSLEQARIPCGKVNSVAEMMNDPHVKARQLLAMVDYPGIGKVPAVTVPFKLSKTPGEAERPAPKVGEHNEEIYCGLLGLSRNELSQLEEDKVI